ncbi:MAG TPA: ABC transporter ATP-binding protein [Pyrinomonadaceae bacterium]|jgi:lipopolysaccharide transport system ATP-binding protein
MQVIKVENLSKLYYLGGGTRHNSLRDTVMGFVHKPSLSKKKQELWALKDLNFTVDDGETLGIIGHNGAGKSTLLKILSRITKPTRGTAEIRGRVASLLEVGTGFHSELSGRENIYLNGAILGMSRREIQRNFDEIIAFAEIEKFIDTPVKFYSSGMYMRLAFAVAAHLEPEVLIVDEVLAVGDMAFQKKCINKMSDVRREGRAVLFVSHNLQAVSRLCRRVIWLERGKVRLDGETQQVVSQYLHAQTNSESEKIWENPANQPGNEITKLMRVRAASESGETTSSFDIRRPVFLELTYKVLRDGKIFTPTIHLYNEEGICVFVSNDVSREWRNRPREKGIYTSRVAVPPNFMAEGSFSVTIAAFTPTPYEEHFFERDAIDFHVFDSLDGDTARGDFGGIMIGVVRPLLQWETDFRNK